MPAPDCPLELCSVPAERLLAFPDGGRRFHHRFKDQRHPVCNSSLQTAAVVRSRLHAAVFPNKTIIGLRAFHFRQRKSGAEADALDARHGKKELRQPAFDRLEKGIAPAGRYPDQYPFRTCSRILLTDHRDRLYRPVPC